MQVPEPTLLFFCALVVLVLVPRVFQAEVLSPESLPPLEVRYGPPEGTSSAVERVVQSIVPQRTTSVFLEVCGGRTCGQDILVTLEAELVWLLVLAVAPYARQGSAALV